ncbi:hypothetical protein SAY86_031804 [Trapa natans]|uniref:Uncharacterized protein n=1 Tax=Trapa natans TaxID=22666 RepID=A0AAN7M7Q0_TRANT|nr:hypothetical protein SAY86_031804 [Trapa natans]
MRMVSVNTSTQMKRKDRGVKKAGILISMCLKAPFRLLSKAAELYVRGITDCSGRAGYGPSMAQLQGLPKSYSSSTSKSTILYTDEDFRELVRAASTRSLCDYGKIQIEIPTSYHHGRYHSRSRGKIARSFTSGIERIDEDRPCEFREDDVRVDDGKVTVVCPRSQNHAVPRGRFMLS